MKISFLVNFPSRHPFGGYKVIYSYANYLCSLGHEVTIVYQSEHSFASYKMPYFFRHLLSVIYAKFGPSWFPLNDKIKRIVLKYFTDKRYPNGDVVIATAVDTAEKVASLSPNKGRKFYFIQHFEDWVFKRDHVLETYKLGMENIVIAEWLKKIVDSESSSDSHLVPNGIDSSIFYIENPIEERHNHSIAALYHDNEWKGSKDAITSFVRLKEKYPDIEVRMFGVPKRPDFMPEWITYIQGASQEQLRHIYNRSSVFLCSSWSEGFGLTGAESIFCGCALVTTDTLGVREYASEQYSIICQPRDVDALVDAVSTLFDNQNNRCEMAKKANKIVTKKLSYAEACKNFAEILTK